MKKLKKITVLLFLILSLTSCYNSEKENTGEKENVLKNEKVNFEEKKVNNFKKDISKMSEEEIKENIKKDAKKRVKSPEKLDRLKFNLDLKNCDSQKDSKICKSIVINIAGTKTKDIKLCDILEDKKDINKCKSKIISKLVAKEMDPKYCEQLEDNMEREMCLGEYKENIKREVEVMKQMEKQNLDK